jgi:hypothetical protein
MRDPRAAAEGVRIGRRDLESDTPFGICGTGGGGVDCVEPLSLLPPNRREPRI